MNRNEVMYLDMTKKEVINQLYGSNVAETYYLYFLQANVTQPFALTLYAKVQTSSSRHRV